MNKQECNDNDNDDNDIKPKTKQRKNDDESDNNLMTEDSCMSTIPMTHSC